MINLIHRVTIKSRSSIRALHLPSTNEPRQLKSTAAAGELQLAGNYRTLYERLSSLGLKKGKVANTINQYIKEGKMPTRVELERCIRQLRNKNRNKFHLALEVIEWMEKRHLEKGVRDYPSHVYLLGRVKGVEEAEKFFDALSPEQKNSVTYRDLFNLYCKEKMEDKALALFNEIEENFGVTSLYFNSLMSLYIRLGQPEKVSPIVEDMKRRNLKLSKESYNVLMTSYVHLNDVEGVERVFEEARRDNPKKCDHMNYVNLAEIYVNSGLHEKAELTLKKLEQVMRPRNREAYHNLIRLYAGTSNLDEVHRIWISLKSEFETMVNTSYIFMFRALGKLDDIVELKKCYEEWESSCLSYDLVIVRTVIADYLRHDMFKDAQMVFRRAIERTSGPFFEILESFIRFHLRNNQVKQALLLLNAAASQVKENEWNPKLEMVNDFVSIFEEKGDVRSAEEFCKIMKKLNSLESLPIHLYTRLIYLLEKVCPE